MQRKLARLSALICAISVSHAFALGLGDINVRSKLNQRFSAVIPIFSATPGQVDSLVVQVADADAFSQAGIERSDYLSELQFKVENGPHGARIVVTGDGNVNEPFLNIIVDARWQGGQIDREYTVLLDPPDSAQPAVAAEAPAPAPVSPAVPAEPAVAQAAPMAPPPPMVRRHPPPRAAATVAAPAPAPTSTGATYGPVAPHETTWSIATKLRPNSGVTVPQELLAIYRVNPAAFDHGQINGLMKGSTLKVPDQATIQSLGPLEAKEQLDALMHDARHAAAVRPAAKTPNPVAGPAIAPKEAATTVQAPVAATQAQNSVKPAATIPPAVASPPAPAQPMPPPAGASASKPAAAAAPPPASPAAATKPAVVPTPAAPLPAPAPAAAPAASAVTALPANKTEPASGPQAASSTPGGTISAPAAGATSSPAMEAPKPKKFIVLPPPPPPPEDDFSLYIEIAVVLLLAALAALFGWRAMRRRKEAQPPEFGMAALQKATREAAPPQPKPVPPPALMSDPQATQPVQFNDTTRIAATAPTPPPKPVSQPVTLATTQIKVDTKPAAVPELPRIPEPAATKTGLAGGGHADFDLTQQLEAQTLSINLDANDPISEADFHLAYGLYDEAASLLKQAVAKEPARSELRVKLAETYFAAGRPVDFQETAESLYSHVSAADWQKIAIMGRQLCPDAALFKSDGGVSPLASDVDLQLGETAAPMSLDFPLDLDTKPATKPASQPAPTSAESNVIDFDFDSELTRPAPAARPSPAPAPAAALKTTAQPAELDLSDFDLGEDLSAASKGETVEFNLDELDLSKPVGTDSLVGSGDEIGTKLDLARAYADMGDNEAARGLLTEVVSAGSEQQRQEAEALLKRLSA